MEKIKNKQNSIESTTGSIGIMDSGVGGLTVLKQMLEICPNENYLFFGDTKNLPYGEKSKEELIKIAKKVFDFYKERDVKAVIMACNTTSATVYEELKDDYDFIIYPLIQIVSKCMSMDKSLKRIAVMATQATVNSGKYKEELQKNNPEINVFEQACPLWVPVVEKKLTNYDEKQIITQYLNNVLDFNPQKIILGCTHYPYLLDKLAKYAPKDLFINPAKIFANYIKQDLKAKNLLCNGHIGNVEYFASANPDEFKENAKLFFEIGKLPELVSL